MTPQHFDVIVIGAGPAGMTAAQRASALGARVALLDRRRTGGTCTNTGCVPTRVLAITARLMRDIHSAQGYGITVSAPRLEWPQTVARVRGVIAEIANVKRVQDKLREYGGEVFLEGSASFVDAHSVRLEDSGRVLTADKFILCTGGKARRPAIDGVEHAITPDQIIDLETLPKSVVIVGSGYTGVQVTTIMSAFGASVTLLETAPVILPPSDADVGRALRESFERQGVRVVTGIGGLEGIVLNADGSRTVIYGLRGKSRSVTADAVILAVGWPADLDGLNLAVAGVEVERGFIKMNAALQTTTPHIFVAGDANGRDMLVQGANFEAEIAAENAVNGASLEFKRDSLPSGGFTDPDHAGVGVTEAQARDSGLEHVVGVARYADLERAIIDGRTPGFLKLIAERESGRIIGAHGTGENAVEVMQAVASAMAAQATAATLAGVRFAYPTYTAIVGEAARKLEAMRGRLEGNL
jgi:pyruvate/2-oxoglutarate dehydrogenase complex dihydrolipoamide dehydrogenase (E3) component